MSTTVYAFRVQRIRQPCNGHKASSRPKLYSEIKRAARRKNCRGSRRSCASVGLFLVRFWSVCRSLNFGRLRYVIDFMAHSTRFERVTFAFGGQRFDTEALERLDAVRPTLPRLIPCGGPFFIWTDLVPHPNLTGASSGPALRQAVRYRAVSSDRRLNPPSVLDSPDWDEPPPACVFLIWAGWAEWSQ